MDFFLLRGGGEVGVRDEDVKEGDEVVNGHTSGRQWRQWCRSSGPGLVRADFLITPTKSGFKIVRLC